MKAMLRSFFIFVFVGAIGFVVIKFYKYIFAKTVIGRIESIEKVSNAVAIVGGAGGQSLGDKALFSTSIMIKTPTGEFWTASSEDRQWGVINKGNCVEARLLPYPPWDLDKANTYHGARLKKVVGCETIGMAEPVAPVVPPPTDSMPPKETSPVEAAEAGAVEKSVEKPAGN